VGGLIMTHSDDNGLVIPPKLAPEQVVVVPIFRNDEQKEAVLNYAQPIIEQLKELGIRVKLDDRENYNPGYKFAEHEAQGVPLRVAVGPRDVENSNVELARRDTLEKNIVPREGIAEHIDELLTQIQSDLYNAAKDRMNSRTRNVDSYDEFRKEIEKGGFIYAHWDGTAETEEKIKQDTKATIRCIPLVSSDENGTCMVTGEPSEGRVLFARAY
jgi:prolyl-tRNA synthetase